MKNKDKMIAFLGKDTVFEGKLAFCGMVRIDGVYKGTVAAVGTLIIGESGRVEGDVQATYAVVNGEIHGNILATESIEIRAPGKVYGDICSPTVIIHNGVVFEGSCSTTAGENQKIALPGRPKSLAVTEDLGSEKIEATTPDGF
jgi:cytoskeletal protein CcmA (bactofilin family)